jgi:hypothetical protein
VLQFHRTLAFETGYVSAQHQGGSGVEKAANSGGLKRVYVLAPGFVGKVYAGITWVSQLSMRMMGVHYCVHYCVRMMGVFFRVFRALRMMGVFFRALRMMGVFFRASSRTRSYRKRFAFGPHEGGG